MHKHYRGPKKQQGMTLIEIIVVLIIGILILAAGAVGISKAFGTNEVATESSNINYVLANTKTLRSAGGYGASGTDLVPTLIAVNALPKTMPVVSGVPQNSWGGTITIVSTGGGYTVTTPSVPKAACIELATKISRGGAIQTKIGTNSAVTGEVTTAVATAQCTSDTANTIAFTSIN